MIIFVASSPFIDRLSMLTGCIKGNLHQVRISSTSIFSTPVANEPIDFKTPLNTNFSTEFENTSFPNSCPPPLNVTFLRDVILPWVVKKEQHTHDIRIWSGASSSGEEPYTIAMVVKDFLGLNYGNWNSTLLATDLSSEVLRYAMQGVYLKEKIEVLPPQWQRANFKRIDEFNYKVKDDIRRNVMFRQFNLMNDFPFKTKMHCIFLRNVMIYFSEDTKRELVNKIYDVLEPGGYFIIGNTENIDKEATNLEFVRPSIFRKPL